MPGLFSTARRFLFIFAILLVLAAGAAWWQRAAILNWYCVHSLSKADETTRAAWVQRVAALDDDVTPELIEMLRQNDARMCANSEAALSAIALRSGPASERTTKIAEDLLGAFHSLSAPGREAVVEWYLATLHHFDVKENDVLPMKKAAGSLLEIVAKIPERGSQVRALALAEVMLGRGIAQKTDLCRDLAVQGMAAKDSEIRSRAIRLVMHAPLHTEKALLDKVVPFLKDASPEVRRSAVLAVGLAEEAIAIQEMLPLLQDSDPEVRRLCENALRGRGLQDDHIKLAKSISDPRPSKRLEVFQLLDNVEDLDPELWLVHLSQDPSPAVRAAAIRFAAEDPATSDFQQRMVQMSREDPSPTVRQLAAHYLKVYRR